MTFGERIHKKLVFIAERALWKLICILRPKADTDSGRVYITDPQKRELHAIMHLLSTPHAAALCNDWWYWFAINVPYQSSAGFSGDIDILLSRPRFVGRNGEIDLGFEQRAFEVKVTLIDRVGLPRSLKTGKAKYKEIKKQLGKLRHLGFEQVFLLEIFVLQRGHSQSIRFPSPLVRDEILRKKTFLENIGYGYIVAPIEPLQDFDENRGGVNHNIYNVLPANKNLIGDEAKNIIDRIDIERPLATDRRPRNIGGPVVTALILCRTCKTFKHIGLSENNVYICEACGNSVF